MKKFISGIIALSLVAAFGFVSVAEAAPTPPPGQNKLLCFSGSADYPGFYNGTCTMQGKGARGPATLNNNDNDSDPFNNYSGVYIESAYLSGTALGDVTKLQFNYTGTATAGSPRFSVAIDETGDGSADGYAFISAYYCNDGAGLVDAINDATCTIYYGSGSYENWDAFVGAFPDGTLADVTYPVYIVADDPGVWTVGGVKLGR